MDKEMSDVKISIALEEQLEEIEVHIRAARISEELRQIERALAEIAHGTSKLVFYKKETEYYLSLTDILFFETDAKTVYAHTAKDIYETKYRLYELETLLPAYFMRVSKSTILNCREIYSITKSISASSLVEFKNCHKQVYVSRNYYKTLKMRLEEMR